MATKNQTEKHKIDKLVYDLKEGNVLPSTLSLEDERFISLYLSQKGMSYHTIAPLIGRCVRTVQTRVAEAHTAVGKLYLEYDIKKWIGDVVESSTSIFKHLLREHRYRDAWSVKRDQIQLLQSMGVIPCESADAHIKISLSREFEELELSIAKKLKESDNETE